MVEKVTIVIGGEGMSPHDWVRHPLPLPECVEKIRVSGMREWDSTTRRAVLADLALYMSAGVPVEEV